MSIKYNDNGTFKDIKVKVGDNIPVGAEFDYDGNTIPVGYEEVSEEIEITSLLGGAALNNAFENKIFKIGRICHLNIGVIPNSTSAATIYKLPEGYRPSAIVDGALVRENAIARIRIMANGDVIAQSSTSGITWGANITWIAQ